LIDVLTCNKYNQQVYFMYVYLISEVSSISL
jgi:hypothetical protein